MGIISPINHDHKCIQNFVSDMLNPLMENVNYYENLFRNFLDYFFCSHCIQVNLETDGGNDVVNLDLYITHKENDIRILLDRVKKPTPNDEITHTDDLKDFNGIENGYPFSFCRLYNHLGT